MKRLRRRLMGILIVTGIALLLAWCILTAMQSGETDIFTPSFFERKAMELADTVRSWLIQLPDRGRECVFWVIDKGRECIFWMIDKGRECIFWVIDTVRSFSN